MKKTVEISDMVITIKRLKMRQVRPLLVDGAEKLQTLFGIFDANGKDMIPEVINFISGNMDWVMDLISSQTDQGREALEELDMLDFINLCSEIIRFNIPDFNMEKLMAFFTPPQPAVKEEEAEAALAAMTFGEQLPAVEM